MVYVSFSVDSGPERVQGKSLLTLLNGLNCEIYITIMLNIFKHDTDVPYIIINCLNYKQLILLNFESCWKRLPFKSEKLLGGKMPMPLYHLGGLKKDLYRQSYGFEFNLELICTSEFFKKLKLHEPLKNRMITY